MRCSTVQFASSPSHQKQRYAKSSNDALSEVLAHDFGPKGVRVNTVHVGATFTETTTSNPMFEEWKNEFSEKIPLRRFAEANEIANAIVFLASDMASYITGIVLKCDGGMSW
ncbi:SDR family oxidoreductase-like protein [Leptotrombidium deliense]|uniref:SDR family oxidoreductase-like protein n=1 Tax=Leptotrombidium deliense TaxID=299467 RepID=A0A443RU49_9ACAR|nr:SDR family oxidoreductase-like protein [Leptotrombidium deliense]